MELLPVELELDILARACDNDYAAYKRIPLVCEQWRRVRPRLDNDSACVSVLRSVSAAFANAFCTLARMATECDCVTGFSMRVEPGRVMFVSIAFSAGHMMCVRADRVTARYETFGRHELNSGTVRRRFASIMELTEPQAKRVLEMINSVFDNMLTEDECARVRKCLSAVRTPDVYTIHGTDVGADWRRVSTRHATLVAGR